MQPICMRAALLGAVLLAGVCSPALAAASEAGLGAQFLQCRDAATGAVEQSACLSDEAQRQDARLNRVYRQLHARLQGKHRGQLVNAQRAWLKSRERDGELESALGASGQIGNLQGELDDLLRVAARADQLQAWLARLD